VLVSEIKITILGMLFSGITGNIISINLFGKKIKILGIFLKLIQLKF
jgi:hypothetical protein